MDECNKIAKELYGFFFFFLDKPHLTADTHCSVAPAAAKQPASSFPQPETLSSLRTAYIHALENHSWAQLVLTPAVNSKKPVWTAQGLGQALGSHELTHAPTTEVSQSSR